MTTPRRMVRRGRFAPRGSARRKLVWTNQSTLQSIAAGGSTQSIVSSSYETQYGMSLQGTIVRTILRIIIAPTGSFTVDYGPVFYAVGLLGRSEILLDVVTTDRPYRDWFIYDVAWGKFSSGLSVPPTDRLYDIRAKRKIDELEKVPVLAITNNGGASVDVRHQIRMLIALP